MAADPGAAPEAVARAGWVALIRGHDLATATRRWKAAIARDPKAPLAWLGLAAADRARLDVDGAARAELAILDRAPGDPLAELAIRWLPDALGTDAGVDADARRTLEKLLTEDGVRPRVRAEARDVLARLLGREGDLEGARKIADAAGGPPAWELEGPYSRFTSLDLDTVFPPRRPATSPPTPRVPSGRLRPGATPPPRASSTSRASPRGATSTSP